MINKSRAKISEVLLEGIENSEIQVWGWIKTARFGKKTSFIELNDGSCLGSLQLVMSSDLPIQWADILTGACIKATGTLVTSKGAGQRVELNTAEITIIGKSDINYPLQKKEHTYEFLREMPHLRGRTDTFKSVLRLRSKLAMVIHDFFQQKGFIYVQSPIITKNDCEGGGETFQVTTLAGKKRTDFDYKDDFFREPAYLTVSGQLEGEAFALSNGAIYTFGPTFRADPSDTPRHAAEFWMIEPEMCFYDQEDLILLIQEFMKSIADNIIKTAREEVEFFTKNIDSTLPEKYEMLSGDSLVMTFTDIIELLNNCGRTFEKKPSFDSDLSIEHERYLVDEHFKKPLFITNYPKHFKPFYMRLNDDNKTVACLDFLVPGIGEIITGSQREERQDLLEERLVAQGLDKELYSWYLETRRWGSAPHSGFGLGFERILMYLSGLKSIRDTIPFPRVSGRIY